MSNLTLAQIQEAVEDKFGDFTIELPAPTKSDPDATEEVAFKYYLRASKEARIKLAAAYREMAEAKEAAERPEEAPSMVDVLQAAMEHLAVKPAHFTKLKRAIGDDLVLWATVVNAYADRYEDQSGEATPSRSS
jgi:hypothetical protein